MKRKIFILILYIIFFISLILYIFNKLSFFDNLIYNFIIQFKSNNITKFMKIITFFASTKFILFIMLILLLFSVFKVKKAYILSISIILNAIINNIVKIIVRRDRPIDINLVKEPTYSFPSGHTMIAVTLYGFLIYFIIKSNLSKYLKVFLICILDLLIYLIMLSRIYLGAHFASDVVSGFSLAFANLLLFIEYLERKKVL